MSTPKAKKLLAALKSKPESYWMNRGQKMALGLFYNMAARVPAYKDFLKKNAIKPHLIKTVSDFRQIPTVSKNTYLRQYPLKDLCWDGKFKEKSWTIAATSGSTGEPFYFPRQIAQDRQYALTAELYLLDNFNIDKKSTLYINGFALGVWIGGLFTYEAITQIARSGKYAISTINAGLDKKAIFQALKVIGSEFDQIIISGYPPFVKDLIDAGASEKINWKKYNIKFIFSAEGFNESWRDYILNKTGPHDPLTYSLNHYGTVDIGTMAHETPLSILVRRESLKNKYLYQNLFNNAENLPTFCQYLPEQFYFEDLGGSLVCSAYSGLPLFKYDLKDLGKVITLDKLKQICQNSNINLQKKISSSGIQNKLWNLPFIYVYKRSDFAVKLRLHDVYAESIRDALIAPKILRNITGKFSMATKYNHNHNQYLEINIEMKPNSKLAKPIAKIISGTILKAIGKTINGPGQNSHRLLKDKGLIKIVPWKYGHELYFKTGIKQKWVKK